MRTSLLNRFLAAIFAGFLAIAGTLAAENLLPPVDDASTDADSNAAWRTKVWNGEGEFDVVDAGRDSDGKCLMVVSRDGGDLSWFHRVAVKTHSVYRLAGWIKMEDIEPTTGRGVVLKGEITVPPIA
jgi:hypothetical protein